jgi:hypothetical protein
MQLLQPWVSGEITPPILLTIVIPMVGVIAWILLFMYPSGHPHHFTIATALFGSLITHNVVTISHDPLYAHALPGPIQWSGLGAAWLCLIFIFPSVQLSQYSIHKYKLDRFEWFAAICLLYDYDHPSSRHHHPCHWSAPIYSG